LTLCYLVTREGGQSVLTGCLACAERDEIPPRALVLTAPGEARQDGGSVAKSDARDVTTLLYAALKGERTP
jgi:hypothetical protein